MNWNKKVNREKELLEKWKNGCQMLEEDERRVILEGEKRKKKGKKGKGI